MGVFETLLGPVVPVLQTTSTWLLIVGGLSSILTIAILLNIAQQLLFRNPHEPPVVFHLVPFFGSTIVYGIDPYKFFFDCRKKYGDTFTFILLGKKTTVCLGTKGNDFILNGKLKDVNAEEIYSPLTTPVFGTDVVYDCPNSKLMEQKKFVKFGLTSSAFKSYVPLISSEVRAFFARDAKHKKFAADNGTINLPPTLAELTIYTASRSLQGKEVRDRFDSSFADLYHDLDGGFTPINFMLPWAPLPQNRKRDAAQRKMTETYMAIIKERRAEGAVKNEEDMIWNLMNCEYKDGKAVPDKEVAHMMIALLMAGQHSSSATISWIMLRLASRPEIQDELLQEQKEVLGYDADGKLKDVTYEDLSRLPLHSNVVRETLRLHAPIHSVMRAVKSPMHEERSGFTIPTSHTLLAAPGVTSRVDEYFPEPLLWEPHRWDDQPAEKHARLSPKHLKEGVVEEKEDYGYGLVSKGAASPYLPFGAGRHRCIGEQFAYLQLQTILATLMRDFRFYNMPGKEGVVETDYSSLFSRPMAPAIVRWERVSKK
ncbi:hypothetical protein AMS68_002154 [Peltaster fructicola]|uniref:Uncharacterized protein n=1 Tax=Peltaster fructicola TaxID=286661 RepID=A0A6H0XPE8_9PEZI|nr:hypothetical protein AMS68_002154 [Peltaster fructicola]